MKSQMKAGVKRLVTRAGIEVTRPQPVEDDIAAILAQAQPHSMTSAARLTAVIDAVRYVDRYAIPGAFVECGVWRGGSTMAAILAHTERAAATRDFFLYDTFEGMPEPGDADRSRTGRRASDMLAGSRRDSRVWAVAGLDAVRDNIAATGLPLARAHFVKGKVEDTIPATPPGPIAVLRLDTDWYESTRHELEHLAPLISDHGVLIVDDYGHWEGARKAVDEWLVTFDRPVLLTRSDYTGRIAVIPPAAAAGPPAP